MRRTIKSRIYPTKEQKVAAGNVTLAPVIACFVVIVESGDIVPEPVYVVGTPPCL